MLGEDLDELRLHHATLLVSRLEPRVGEPESKAKSKMETG